MSLEAAQALAARGDWPGARAALEALAAASPGDAGLRLQLSYIESLAGDYRAAHARALEADALAPAAPDAVMELAARLRTFNEIPRLFACAERHAASAAPDAGVLLALATHLGNVNVPERALPLADAALRAAPGSVAALAVRANLLTFLGRFAEARSDLEQALATAPMHPQSRWLLARLRKATPGDHQVASLRAALARPQRPADEVAMLAYALHKELDDLGEHAAAAAALDQACRAKRSTLRYSSGDTEALASALEAWRPPGTTAASDVADRPVPLFIVGMHRSGTTLLEQMLDGHGQVRGVGELYDFTAAMRQATGHHCRGVIDATIVERAAGVDFAAVGRAYLDGLAWRLGDERCFTDKLPSNFLNLGFICSALPHARILHMVRDPVEVCFSNLRELFSDANPHSYDQRELADYYRQYRRLMAHWHRLFPGRILDVEYAALVRDPEGQARRIAAFCGLPYSPAMIDIASRERGVGTASTVQVREGIVVRERPKWAPYADYLQPMIDALGGLRDPART